MITEVKKLSDFPLLSANNIRDAKLIIAVNGDNYSINLSQIKETSIKGIVSSIYESTDKKINNVDIYFDDGNKTTLIFSSGSRGDAGPQGDKGDKGLEGASGAKAIERADNTSIKGVFTIVNNNETGTEQGGDVKAWSAYCGKLLRDLIHSINEVFMTDDEYQLLFNEPIFLNLEFNSNKENTQILYQDDHEHVTYVKYWTYEDEDEDEYFIKVGEDEQHNDIFELTTEVKHYWIWVQHEEGDSFEEVDKATYDADENVDHPKYMTTTYKPFDIWDDYYKDPDNNNTYAIRHLVQEFDPITGEIASSHWEYTLMTHPTWLNLQFTTDEDETSIILNEQVVDPDDYKEERNQRSEEEVIVIDIPITHISISPNYVRLPVNKAIKVPVHILPLNYNNDSIFIEYDEDVIKVFEDGRIMAIKENVDDTVVKIYTKGWLENQDNTELYTELHINVITWSSSISFTIDDNDTWISSINSFKDREFTVNPIVYPATSTDKRIEWTIMNENLAEIVAEDTETLPCRYYIWDKDIDEYVETKDVEKYNNDHTRAFNTNVYVYVDEEEEVSKDIEYNVTIDDNVLKLTTLNNSEFYYIQLDAKVGNRYEAFIDKSLTQSANRYVEIVEEKHVKYISHYKVTDNAPIKIRLLNEGETELQATLLGASSDTSFVVNIHIETAISDIEVEDNIDILVGHIKTIEPKIIPENATHKILSWDFGDNNNYGYRQIGNVTGDDINGFVNINRYNEEQNTGTIIVKAMDHENDEDNFRKIIHYNVKVPVSNIQLNSNNVSLDKGDTFQITATVNNDAFNKELIYETDAPAIATVDENGLITAIGNGTATITVSATDGSGVTTTITVRSIILIESISIKNNITYLYSGNEYRIVYSDQLDTADAIVYNINEKSLVENLVWYTSDSNIATVETGTDGSMILKLNENNAGQFKLYAMANDNGGVVSNITINAMMSSEELLLADEQITIDLENDTYTLIASVYPDDTTYQKIKFEVEDPTILSIDSENGIITPLKRGETKIIVSTISKVNNGKLSKECPVIII